MASFYSCENIRNRGNQEFKKAFGVPPASKFAEIRIESAQKAQKLYLEATKIASGSKNATEWLSAKKNLGITCMRLAAFEKYQNLKSRQLVLFQFKESLMHLSEALHYGHEISKTFAWIDDIAFRIKECCNLALLYIIENSAAEAGDYGLRCSTLSSLIIQPTKQTLAVAIIQSMVADEIIKAAIIADENEEWLKSFSLVCEAERPTVECEAAVGKIPIQYGLYPELTEHLRDLQHSRLTYLTRSESAKLREIANQMQDNILFEHENLDMDMLWVCVDQYRASMMVASRTYEGFISRENEAIAASNLGKLYDKVLRMHALARILYMHAIHLVDILTHQCGSTFFKCEWYQDAKCGIEEDNIRSEAYDNAKIAEQREPILLKLKPELDAIAAAVASFEGRDYSAHALLVHLYAKHPPKKDCRCKFDVKTLNKDESSEVQKGLFKTITYYHPDRWYNKTAGIEWLILCGEITTTLNNSYARGKL